MIFVETDGILEFIARFLGGIKNQEFLIAELTTKICPCITLILTS
jgi:hypothetical protein